MFLFKKFVIDLWCKDRGDKLNSSVQKNYSIGTFRKSACNIETLSIVLCVIMETRVGFT